MPLDRTSVLKRLFYGLRSKLTSLARDRDGMSVADKINAKSVLFVCIENSCRSQMAQGFVRIQDPPMLQAYSAGSKPSGIVNPIAIWRVLAMTCLNIGQNPLIVCLSDSLISSLPWVVVTSVRRFLVSITKIGI